jgi:hypothetical protein
MALPASPPHVLTLDDYFEAISANIFNHFCDPQQRRGTQMMGAPTPPKTPTLAYTPGRVCAHELVYALFGAWRDPAHDVLAQPSVLQLTERLRRFINAHENIYLGTFCDEADGRLWHEVKLYDKKRGALRFTIRISQMLGAEQRVELHIIFTPPKPEDTDRAVPMPVLYRR